MFRTMLLMALCSLTLPLHGEDPPQGLRVFYVSQSGMWYVPDLLSELATSANIKGHQSGLQKLAASRTLQHWMIPEHKNQAKKALQTGQVDVFVMSPIQFPDEGVENFVKLGLEHNPKMRFLVQITWGGGDIDNQDFPKGAFAKVDREKTPDQLAKLYARNIQAAEAQADDINRKYSNGKKVLFLVPSAQALVTLRTRIARHEMPGLNKQAELFRDAMSHPTAPLEALNAYLHYAVLYHRSPVGLADLIRRAKKETWDEKLNRTLQELGWETAANYPYAGVNATVKK
jgi:hypothetical protein